MKRLLLTSIFVIGSFSAFGQVSPPATSGTQVKDTKTGISYGRVKEFTAGQKLVIDIDNAVDKTFDLTNKDLTVNTYKGLKVGDPVMVDESKSTLGKTKSVTISKHEGGGVKHGDKP